MAARMRVRELMAGARGARLCYGKPVRAGDLTVIPVARIWSAGGGGWGRQGSDQEGGGGGGIIDAQPVGFIEVTKDGSRYIPIRDFERAMRAVRSAATAIGALAAAAAATRAAHNGGLPSARKLLGRGR
jgi:uncharacterized spore protein YtfJ